MTEIERQSRCSPCCLCLSEDETTFNSNSIMKSLPLYEMVDFCIGIKINTGKDVRPFSTSICNECVLNINNFYTFKKKVLEAQELMGLVKNDSNNESAEEYVEDDVVQTVELNDGVQMLEEDIQNGNEMNKRDGHQKMNANNQATRMIRIVKVDPMKKRVNGQSSIQKNPSKKIRVEDAQCDKITIQMNECLICPAVLGDILQLKAHIEKHKDIKCKACKRQFARYSNLKRHFNSVHSKPKPFQCDICGLGFNFSVNLQTHAALHYSGKIRSEQI